MKGYNLWEAFLKSLENRSKFDLQWLYATTFHRPAEGNYNKEFLKADILAFYADHPKLLNTFLLKRTHNQKTIFCRMYKSKIHKIVAHHGVYEYNGQTYKSLAAIAYLITGTKNRNGVFFFQSSVSCRIQILK